MNYTELLISYWDAIGVEVEADVQPLAEFAAKRTSRDFEMISAEGAFKGAPTAILGKFLPSSGWNSSNADEEWYNAKFAEAVAATTLDEQYAALRELNTYGIEQFWQLWALVGPQFSLAQPWVAGYNGETMLGQGAYTVVFARLWFDSSLKP